MAYVDLNTIHNPSTGVSPPASWGDQVRDNFEFFNSSLSLGSPTSGTPTLIQSVTVAKTVTFYRWFTFGKLVILLFDLAITGSGTSGNAITMGLPVVANTTSAVQGNFTYQDFASTFYVGGVYPATASTVQFQTQSTDRLGINPAFAAANGDRLFGLIAMQAA